MLDVRHFVAQLDRLIQQYQEMLTRSKHDDLSDLPDREVYGLITSIRAAIERVSGSGSPYTKQADKILGYGWFDAKKAGPLIGVAESLRSDIEAGYVQTIFELAHGEVFSDFLEMASHLLDQGYKDAAAVIGGSALEAHLRQLCHKFSVDTEVKSPAGVRPKRADAMNSDLAKVEAYSKLDQKNVTAWLDLRNKAAHGEYGEYTKVQVAIMIAGIRDFLTRHQA
jgi:hypothetical protein